MRLILLIIFAFTTPCFAEDEIPSEVIETIQDGPDVIEELVMAPENKSIFLGPMIFSLTFFIEEIAIAAGAYLVAVHRLDGILGFISLHLGIFLSDVMIYFFGVLIARSKWIQSYADVPYYQKKASQYLDHGFWTTIIISRIVPGALIPIFLVLGFTKTNLYKVSFVTFCVTGVYTAVALYFLLYLGLQISDLLDYGVGIALGALFAIYLLRHQIWTFIKVQYHLFRAPQTMLWPADSHKGLPPLEAPRSLNFFEGLPMAVTYTPIVFAYLYYAIKFRSLSAPLTANPGIENSGICGESKSKILSSIPERFSHMVPRFISVKVSDSTSADEILKLRNFPFVAKPDIGYMSRGVELISNKNQLTQYLEKFPKDQVVIFQDYVAFDAEAGIFYARTPNPVVKVALTYFPFVVGDGKRSVGELIKHDPRYAHFEPSFSKSIFGFVPKTNEIFRLKLSGSTQDGSLHTWLRLPADSILEKNIRELSESIPEFWIGRYDVKFESVETLLNGEFKILELNGAAGEDLTAWDVKRGFFYTYKTLFRQLKYLFQIGKANKERGCTSITGAGLLKAFIEQESLLFRLTRAQYKKRKSGSNTFHFKNHSHCKQATDQTSQ